MISFRNSSLSYSEWLTNGIVDLFFNNWRSRARVTRAVLVILLLMNFRTFEYFPGFRLVQDSWYAITLAIFVVLYPLTKISLDWTFTRVELYLLGILPVLFILPAITAHSVFGQPIFYGIFPQRSAIPVLWWLLFVNFWRLKLVHQADVRSALLISCWGTFILFNVMRLTLNPANFDQVGFTVGTEGDAAFTFPMYFAVFGAFYYTLQGLRKRQGVYYLLGAMQSVSALGHSGRSLAVAIVVTLLFFLYQWRGFIGSLPVVAISAGLLLTVTGLSFLVDPTGTASRVGKYADAFRVVGGASEVQDVSANARIFETETAKPYIATHPILGVGAVSLQWQGGLVAAVGDYFVPGDIGFIGILFTYGGFGLVVFLAQYLFAFAKFSGNYAEVSSPTLDATRAFILFSAFYSAVTGLFVFGIEATSFFIILVTLLKPEYVSEALPIDAGEMKRQSLLPAGS